MRLMVAARSGGRHGIRPGLRLPAEGRFDRQVSCQQEENED